MAMVIYNVIYFFKAELLKKMLETDIPRFVGIFEKLLEENGSTGFFIGEGVSIFSFDIYFIFSQVDIFSWAFLIGGPIFL